MRTFSSIQLQDEAAAKQKHNFAAASLFVNLNHNIVAEF